MISPAFLKKLKELRQSRLRTQDFQKWKAANPTAATGTGVWNAAPWTGQTAQAIVYDTTNGKAFPNPQAALSAGVSNFSYQVPAGMTVDWSYWDQFRQPPPPPRPVAQPVTVTNQTLPFTHDSETGQAQSPTSQPATSAPETSAPEPEPFQMPDQAKRFADAGMFGRASAAVKAAGGTWSKDMHRQLKKDAGSNKNFGGDFKNQGTIDGILANTDLLADATSGPGGKISYKVPMGKAKKEYEKIHGKGSFTKETHVAIAAAQKRKEKAERDSRNR
tara:strand:- start:9429 stop:10253 length:825 start_codon:yes stop_codon:yes gene_type:complete